jgi:hypothetical protein
MPDNPTVCEFCWNNPCTCARTVVRKSIDETVRALGTLVLNDAEQNGYTFALVVIDETGAKLATNMSTEQRIRAGKMMVQQSTNVQKIGVGRGGQG